MKKLFLLPLFLASVFPLTAQENISMVAYFPVPYVSYLDLHVTKSCDVGLVGQCRLKLEEGWFFNDEDPAPEGFLPGSMLVREGVLELNSLNPSGTIAGKRLLAGTDREGKSLLNFTGILTVQSGLLKDKKLYSLKAENATLKNLFLGQYAFPTCTGSSAHSVRWKKLQINGKTRTFLTCS